MVLDLLEMLLHTTVEIAHQLIGLAPSGNVLSTGRVASECFLFGSDILADGCLGELSLAYRHLVSAVGEESIDYSSGDVLVVVELCQFSDVDSSEVGNRNPCSHEGVFGWIVGDLDLVQLHSSFFDGKLRQQVLGSFVEVRLVLLKQVCLLDTLGERLGQSIGDVENRYKILPHFATVRYPVRRHVASGLADLWENFLGDPRNERFGFRLAALEDESVETSFGDDCCVLHPTGGLKGVCNTYSLWKISNILLDVLDVQHLADIFCDEPDGLVVFLDYDADIGIQYVVVYLVYLIHITSRVK